MATTTVYLRGTCKWAKLKQPDKKYNIWSIDLYPDEASLAALKKSGAQTKIRIDEKEDHQPFIRLRRDVTKLIKDKQTEFSPPELLDDKNKPLDVNVGNGSEVTCKLTVYDTSKGKGSRLEAVRVEKLVPYEGSGGVVINELDLPF